MISKYQRDKLLHIIEKLISWDICAPFRELVDPIRDGATDYFDVIKEPMSLNEVKKKLVNNQYSDLKAISYDPSTHNYLKLNGKAGTAFSDGNQLK